MIDPFGTSRTERDVGSLLGPDLSHRVNFLSQLCPKLHDPYLHGRKITLECWTEGHFSYPCPMRTAVTEYPTPSTLRANVEVKAGSTGRVASWSGGGVDVFHKITVISTPCNYKSWCTITVALLLDAENGILVGIAA